MTIIVVIMIILMAMIVTMMIWKLMMVLLVDFTCRTQHIKLQFESCYEIYSSVILLLNYIYNHFTNHILCILFLSVMLTMVTRNTMLILVINYISYL